MKLLLFVCISASILFAGTATKPYPQQRTFKGMHKPSAFTQEQLDSITSDFYAYWKKRYLVESGSTEGGYYIKSGGGTGGSTGLVTISEAHGWAMIITALMAGDGPLADPDAEKIFQGLTAFYQAHPCESNQYLMSWEVLGNGKGGEQTKASSSATDGDLDIAYALLLAEKQWGNKSVNYGKIASDMITKGLYGIIIGKESKRSTLGSWDNEKEYQTRPSDWMPGHLRAFGIKTGDSFWNSAADTVYSVAKTFISNHSKNTWLISDFVVGKEPKPAGEFFLNEFKETDAYYNNACRVPLRIAVDVAHNQTAFGKEWLQGLTSWITPVISGQPVRIVGGYHLDGTPVRDTKFPAFTAPLVVASAFNENESVLLNNGVKLISQWKKNYYNDTITLLSLLLISGNWWEI